MQNSARNGKKVTQVIYRVADHKYIIYIAMPTSVMGQIFGNLMKQNIARNGNTMNQSKMQLHETEPEVLMHPYSKFLSKVLE